MPSPGLLPSAAPSFLSSILAGVPTRDGSSDSSSITKVPSNSEGSGPLITAASSSFGFGFRARLAGDSVRDEVDCRPAVEADLEIGAVDAAAFWRACSSAMRESIAPLIRFGRVSKVNYWANEAVDCFLVPGT